MPATTFDQILHKAQRPTGCGVLVVRRDGKVLTGTRLENASRGQICGPGGHIEPGETPRAAAKREAMEEFGIICNKLVPLGTQRSGKGYGTSAVFLCTDYIGKPMTDEEEMTEPKWLTIKEAEEQNCFPPFARSLRLLEKETAMAKTFDEILKFNPYHDAAGRFTHAGGHTSFTYAPGKSRAHDLAIEREKQRTAGAGSAGGSGEAGGSSAAEESTMATTPGGHKPYMKGQELFDYTAKELGVSQQEAKDMIKEVSGYTDGYATDMRNWQQYGDGYILNEMTSKEAKTMSEQCEKFIKLAPKWDGGELYRGISLSEDEADKLLDDISFSMKPFDMKGTSSWSSDKSIADDFGGMNDGTVILRTPGTKKGTSIDHISNFSQSEVLISRDARWDVKRINGSIDDGYLEIYLEERP